MDANFEIMRSLAPDASDEMIIAALRKHPNNLDAAVGALFDHGDLLESHNDNLIGPAPAPLPEEDTFIRGRGVLNAGRALNNNSPVQIDLTKPSPENTTSLLPDTTFFDAQESDKANWGVIVPSQPAGPVQYGPHLPSYMQSVQQQQQRQQDDDLSLAISASLHSSMLDSGSSSFVEIPLAEQPRPTPFFPVTLRSRTPRFVYIAMLMQAMYYVPHIRTAFSRIASDHRDMENLQPFWEAMARMEMGVQRDIHLDDLIRDHVSSENDENGVVKDIRENLSEFYSQFASEMSGPSQAFPSRLLISQIWQPPSFSRSSFGSNTGMWVNERSLSETGITQDYPLIPITSNINSEENSLLSYLHELTWSRKLQVAADVLVFSITQEEGLPTPSIYRSTPTIGGTNGKGTNSGSTSNAAGKPNASAPSQKYPLQFPAQLYVDPFMLNNLDIAKIQKEAQIKMETKVRDIERKISALGGGTNKLPLKNLQMSIKYYQEIIANDGTQEQKELNKATLEALEAVLDRIEKEIDEKKDELSRTKKDITELYDLTALKKMPYELCAVLMWDGVYGRSHVYSYVKAKDGNWYKIVDSSVTQVTEEAVLTDSSGLHLTAGPFMLFYNSLENPEHSSPISQEAAQEGLTRPLSKETYSLLQRQFSEWNRKVREIVRRANSEFRTQLANEQVIDEEGHLVKQAQDSTSDSPTKTMWVDPLHYLHIIDEEKEMVYDSDPEEMNMDEITELESHEAPASRNNTSKGLWNLSTSNEGVKDDTGPGWVPQGDPDMTWEEALTKESSKETNWDGWGSQSAQEANRIEVQVTRTVETDSPEVGVMRPSSPPV